VGEAAGAPWRVIEDPADTPERRGGTGSRRPFLVIVAGAIAVILGATAFVLAATGGGGGGVAVADDESHSPALELGSSGRPSGAMVVVEVVGAVRAPGVFRLPAGSRVGDAIEAAGGYSARLDATRAAQDLNLAAKLEDGAQIRVPSRDDAPAATAGGPAGPGPASGGGLVHLNRATAAELDALPGIGPVTAAKILASRDEKPFATVDDLLRRKLVGASTFEKLRALVAVP
jgi:competence protein ComEA